MSQPHAVVTLAEQPPYLIRAIQRLAQHTSYRDNAQQLLHDLSDITAMVAEKFTNDRTAEGIQQALRLTVGCVSLALSHAPLRNDDEAALAFLVEHGAEHTFQKGFRLIRELANLPEVAMVSQFDHSEHEQQRQLKNAFLKFCDADPNTYWMGYQNFLLELKRRKNILAIIECARWLRQHNHGGAIKEEDMDADGVIAVAVIFATSGNAEIVARAGQKKLQLLLEALQKAQPDFAASWTTFLSKIPAQHRPVVAQRVAEIQPSKMIVLLQKAMTGKPTKAQLASLNKELQNHGGSEVDIDYP
jgi:hypothetical protein